MISHSPRRQGYTLLIVLGFVILFTALLGLAYQQLQSAVLVETVNEQESIRDQGSVQAVAYGLELLETGTPPSDPYVCGVTIQTTAGAKSYVVTFTSNGTSGWIVQAAPQQLGQSPDPMPSAFFSDSIP
jgi:hypothetical protein